MLTIEFKKDGSVVMTPTGYPGSACRRVTDYYGKAITGEVTSDEPTAEAYEPERDPPVADDRTESV